MNQNSTEDIRIVTKFLETDILKDQNADTVSKILELAPSSFKFINEDLAREMRELLKIESIKDLTNLDPNAPVESLESRDDIDATPISAISEKFPDFGEKLKKAVTLSLLFIKAQEKKEPIKKKEQKTVVLGLSNAGKTSLLSRFGGQLGIQDLASLEPTRGVERSEIETDEMVFYIWDFGGQEDHREEYLKDPEKYFLGIDLIIYVIDIQASEQYEESILYFKRIVEVLNQLEESPYFMIFIHKYDPAIENDIETLLNIEYVKYLIKPILKDNDYDYDIYMTSIYSSFSNEPKFVKLIKDIVEDKGIKEDNLERKMERVGRIMEKTLDAVVELSTNLMNLQKRVAQLEGKDVGELETTDIESDQTETEVASMEKNKMKTKTEKELDDVIIKKDESSSGEKIEKTQLKPPP
ncbi:MAG: hypothetical protein GF311_21350 [Candidatus Lokiarchaeota archaeon]|nr:hypothetical protein [Candidatus Lokiarchaeota archaeon]